MASRAAQAPAQGLEAEDLLVEDAEASTGADAEAQDGFPVVQALGVSVCRRVLWTWA